MPKQLLSPTLIRAGMRGDIIHFSTFQLEPDRPLWVIQSQEGAVAAYVQCYQRDERGTYMISLIETSVEHRRKGLASAMVRFFQAQPEVDRLVALDVLFDAIPFWERLGFEPSQRRHYEWCAWW